MKLGKRPVRYDTRTAKLATFLDDSSLPSPPCSTNRAWTAKPAFQMFGNDRYGDCTCAGMGNAEIFWSSLAKSPVSNLSTQDALTAYEAITAAEGAAFSPGPPPVNDNGCVELDVLNYWKNVGFAGHKVQAYAAVDMNVRGHVRLACWAFDGLYIGLQLPLTAQGQDAWRYEPAAGSAAAPGSWGGHCVVITDYSNAGLWCVTWGGLKWMSWGFFGTYCDEAYAIISLDDFLSGGRTLEGFDATALNRYLASVSA